MTGPAAVRVDRGRCTGSGSCVFHAPGTFDVDDDMKVVLVGGQGANGAGDAEDTGDTGDPPAAVTAAVEGCPSRALSFAPPG